MSNPVVTHQPGAGSYGTNVQTGTWSTNLCSCYKDVFVCECYSRCLKCRRYIHAHCHLCHLSKVHSSTFLCCVGCLGFFCPAVLACYTSHKYGENCFLGCFPGGLAALRTHMRLTYGIAVSYLLFFIGFHIG